jgi:hypothetical protein
MGLLTSADSSGENINGLINGTKYLDVGEFMSIGVFTTPGNW